VQILGERRFVEILADWGLHEAEGRLREILPSELTPAAAGPERVIEGLEVAIRNRSPLVGRLLLAQPRGALRVGLAPEEGDALYIFDGQTLRAWSTAILAEETPEGEFVRGLVHSDVPVAGPFVCMVTVPDGDLAHPKGPIVLYDGWHRAAAWFKHCQSGRPYPILADLILTNGPDPLCPLLFAQGGDPA